MPTGRAFRGPVNGYMDKLNKALSISENVAWGDMLSTFDSAIPDNINGNFTHADATDWERRLGLIQYSPFAYTYVPQHYPLNPIAVPTLPPLSQRLLAIQQQYNYPGATLARGNWHYIQTQLQAAGFHVYIYENRFFVGGNWITKNPVTIAGGGGFLNVQYGQKKYGQTNYGGTWNNIIVNNLILQDDLQFQVGNNLRSTFFIGGSTLGAYANIQRVRMNEFRQLILKLKPVQTVGYLFVNYI